MKEIIKIENRAINSELIKTIDARELHIWLKVETPFRMWIKRRIEEYQFEFDKDYIITVNTIVHRGNNGGSSTKKDYYITLDTAKELSMVERTNKGREARKYFIECEKKLLTNIIHEKPKKTENWDYRRSLSKTWYRTHTDAIKKYLIDEKDSQYLQSLVYADEADILNVAIFGITAAQWREEHEDLVKKRLNIRDFATDVELIVLSQLEGLNAYLITQGLSQEDRFKGMRKQAKTILMDKKFADQIEEITESNKKATKNNLKVVK